ncbi:MAG: metal ABC transporter ATP-binding protein [Bacillota bacterium]|nr:metal ABC transporter ATP-binding protein [Bacillota bacterium]
MNKNAVVVHDLTVAYNQVPVLLDIDLSLPGGSLNAIIGPNGAGKTTLLKAVLGLLKPITGEVHFPDLGFEKLPKKTTKIAYVPQSGSIDWDFPATVLDIVLMGRYGHLGWFKRPGKADKAIALEALEKMEMTPYVDRQISELSGGQQQRVFLARALAQDAQLYFMDEPFKGVDARTQNAIVSLMKEIKSKNGTVIVVHHDLTTVNEYFDWVTIIRKQVISNGPTATAFTEEKIKLAFGEGIRI